MLHYCNKCGKSYKWKGELRSHIYRNHTDQKPRYPCSLCNRSYADRRKLRHHMVTKHNIPKEMTYYKTFRPLSLDTNVVKIILIF